MKVENGRMVYEEVPCWWCKGAKVYEYGKLCPLMHQAVNKYPGRVCPHCKSKSKSGHTLIGTEIKTCETCKGSGVHHENAYDSVPAAIWQGLTFKVYRSNRKQTMVESLLGVGVYSVTDYGRHQAKTDEDLIEEVRGNTSSATHQAISGIVSRADHGRICDHIAIVCSDNGYSVVGYFEPLPEPIVLCSNTETADNGYQRNCSMSIGHTGLCSFGCWHPADKL